MVHEVASGKNTTVGFGFKRALHNLPDIAGFAAASAGLMLLSMFFRRKGRLGKLGAGILDTFSGIIGRLVLPAMIVTERSFGQAVVQLKDSIRALPEIVTYEIGIRPLKAAAFFFSIIVSVFAIFIFNVFFGVILFMLFFVGIALLSIYVNITYYTLLYISLIERRKVAELDVFR